jgi:selenocysteine lyase/cysteine desulfurase
MVQSIIARERYGALRKWRYFNQASLGLIPIATNEAAVTFINDIGQNGNIFLSDDAEERILDNVRAAAARLLDAPLHAVALVGGASEALGQLATLLATRDGEVVLVKSDFPSVTYPWLNAQKRLGTKLRWVQDHPESDLTTEIVEAISESTSVVCFSAVQFATGSLIDVPAVVRRARAKGTRVVVDVTQMAGAAPVSMREWAADALVCSGYKWLSSHGGVAILAMSDQLLEDTPPLVGWKGAERPFDFSPQTLVLASGARKYELSTSSYSSAIGLQESIGMLMAVGMSRLAEHASTLSRELVNAVCSLGWTPFKPVGERGASGHIVSLRHSYLLPRGVQRELVDKYRIVASSRGGGIRISLHGYNDSEDVVAFADALRDIGRNQSR